MWAINLDFQKRRAKRAEHFLKWGLQASEASSKIVYRKIGCFFNPMYELGGYNIAPVSSLWSSGTAVEVHADGPVSIPIASKDEDILHGSH